MEPGVYDSWSKGFIGELPPIPPIPPIPDTKQLEDEAARSNPPPDTNWTVLSPNISRGNLDREPNHNDIRMAVGWNAAATHANRHQSPGNMPWTVATPQAVNYAEFRSPNENEETPRASDQPSVYPHPNLSLPHPSLSLDFRMSVTLNPRISVGTTPFGHRNWISFTGGSWSGCWGAGIVLPGGQESQLIIPDGSARLETNYLLQTHETPSAYISVKTTGWRTGPPEVLARLADPSLADTVDPNLYKFRIFIEMETGDERYRDKVNCGIWVGSGMRKGLEVIYDAYRIS